MCIVKSTMQINVNGIQGSHTSVTSNQEPFKDFPGPKRSNSRTESAKKCFYLGFFSCFQSKFQTFLKSRCIY